MSSERRFRRGEGGVVGDTFPSEFGMGAYVKMSPPPELKKKERKKSSRSALVS